ncbi:uncharacterized protein METZ01_LOCUS352933, partial [marine metagenome]
MKKINVGLIGFGTIGAGVAKILAENQEVIQKRLGATVCLAKIADLDITTDRGINVEDGVLTTSVDDIIENPEIDVVIELIGGYEPARTFILKALKNNKHVVTANKALLAKHGDEIFEAVEEKGLSIGFEASIGGAIPIIRSIREGF